jgi:hypothetical protein
MPRVSHFVFFAASQVISPCHGLSLSLSLSLSWSCAIPDYCKVGDFAAFQVPKEHSFYSEELPIDVAFLTF